MDVFHRGIWLGLLDHRGLNQATTAYYRSTSKYKDPAYNSGGLLDWETAAIERFFLECRSVLVGAAGGGREVAALAQRGFMITAFDCSEDLVDICRALVGENTQVLLVPPGQVPESDRQFDGIVVGWGGYMHIVGTDARLRFLRALRSRVVTGGPVLVSFLTRNPEARRYRWIRNIARLVRRLRLSGDPVELGDTVAGSFDHHFTRDEIESELERAGFRVKHSSDVPYGHAVGIAT